MKKQTPLQKKISELEEVRARKQRLWMPTQEIDDSINLLKSLLPYERECIEAAHKAGLDDYNSSSDYYNSNYSQDKTETDGKD